MSNYITTLRNKDGSDGLLPRTVLKAIADDNGNYLDNTLTADDINALKNGSLGIIKSKPISYTTDSNGNIDVYSHGDVPTDAKPIYFVQTSTSVDVWIVPFQSINGHPHIHAANWNGTAKGSTTITGTLYYL